MFFREIIGQQEVKSRLIRSVKEGIVAHAQLFCGAEGVGNLAAMSGKSTKESTELFENSSRQVESTVGHSRRRIRARMESS